MRKDFAKITLLSVFSLALALCYTSKQGEQQVKKPEGLVRKVDQELRLLDAAKRTRPEPANLKVALPPHLSYPQTVAQLKQWRDEAQDLVEVEPYGQTAAGTDIFYIRVGNRFDRSPKPVVLMTAAIHGNEPLSSGILMAYVGGIIDRYGKDPDVTDLVDSRDMYFIPVVSPDSYAVSRLVGDVDPNRDFPTPKNKEHQSIREIMALREFFYKISPRAIVSGHTFGRFFMTPYGDSQAKTPHDADYARIVGRMAEMTGYRKMRCADLYGRPIDGSEVDWFYRNGSIAICAEFGDHQDKPTPEEIKSEYLRVRDALHYFAREAPGITVKVADEGVDFSRNTGIARKYARLPNGDLVPAGPYQKPE